MSELEAISMAAGVYGSAFLGYTGLNAAMNYRKGATIYRPSLVEETSNLPLAAKIIATISYPGEDLGRRLYSITHKI